MLGQQLWMDCLKLLIFAIREQVITLGDRRRCFAIHKADGLLRASLGVPVVLAIRQKYTMDSQTGCRNTCLVTYRSNKLRRLTLRAT